MTDQPNVEDLVKALHAFREEWALETLSASLELENGLCTSVAVKPDGSAWVVDAEGSVLRIARTKP